MKNATSTVLLLLVLAGALAAQSYPGDFIIAGQWYSSGDTIARIDRQTLTISTMVGKIGTTTTNSYYVEAMMAENNADIYLFHNASKSVYLVDAAGQVIRTVFNGTGVISTPYDMFLDQNGDIILVDYSTGMYKVDRVTGAHTMVLSSGALGSSARSAIVDIDSGNWLIAATDNYVHKFDILSGTTTTITVKAPSSFRYQVEQDHATGLLYTGTCCSTATSGNGMFVLDPVGQTSSVLVGATNPPLRAWYAHRFDRRVQTPGNNVIHSSVNGFAIANNFSALVALTQQGVITSLVTYGQPATGVLTAYGMEIEGSRNLSSLLTTGPNNRDILVSFPNHGGKAYVAALGISGVRPGLPLGDGRMINLVPDTVTVASLNNWLPGIWNPGPGTLDAFGRAIARLDANILGSAVRGLPVWVAAAVIDPTAPKGFAAIAETHVIQFE